VWKIIFEKNIPAMRTAIVILSDFSNLMFLNLNPTRSTDRVEAAQH
jgi:hypothetical protein